MASAKKNPLVKNVSKAKGRTIVEMNTPAFQTEDEEAAWWEANRSDVIDMVIRYGKRAPSAKTKLISIRVPESDLGIAKVLAGERGRGYQSYLKDLLHDALQREAAPRMTAAARKTRSGS